MRLIVGLGNPGERYEATPHNLGFLVVDELARRLEIPLRRPEADSLVGRGRFAEHDVVLAKPQTFMNLSGRAVRKLLEQWELTPPDVVVIVDDLDLPWRQMRIRDRGGPGTHNGLRSVVEEIGSIEFARVRMGIQPDHPVKEAAEFVLRPFEKTQRETVGEFVKRGAEATEVLVREGITAAMNQFNLSVAPSAPA